MERRDNQIRFWQIFSYVTLGLALTAIILMLLPPLRNMISMQSIMAYILGGILGTWLIVMPIAYILWVKPIQKPNPSDTPSNDDMVGRVQMNRKDAMDLKIRYRFSLIFFGFFIVAMLFQLFAFMIWGLDVFINSFWITVILLGMGLANLASIIHQSRVSRIQSAQEEIKRTNRLNQWWIVFLIFGAAWLIAVWVVFPRMIPDLSHIIEGMIAAAWLILAALSYLLYVIRYPQEQ
jgi:uncharacterized membrane protein